MAEDILNLRFLIDEVLRSSPSYKPTTTNTPSFDKTTGTISGQYTPRQEIQPGIDLTSTNIRGSIDPSLVQSLVNVPVGVSGGYSQSTVNTNLPEAMRIMADTYGLDLQDATQRQKAYDLAITSRIPIPVGDVGEITGITGRYGRQQGTYTDFSGESSRTGGRSRGVGLEGLIKRLGQFEASYDEQTGSGMPRPERTYRAKVRIPLN